MLVASVVGIIPFCFMTEYHNPHSSPSIKNLHERFNIGKTSACAHKFLSSLAAHMISNSSYSDIRTAEQTCCKAMRQQSEKDTIYRDLCVSGHNVYSLTNVEMGLHLGVHFPAKTGRKPIFLKEGMLTHWRNQNRWMTMKEIASATTLPTVHVCYELMVPSPNTTRQYLYFDGSPPIKKK